MDKRNFLSKVIRALPAVLTPGLIKANAPAPKDDQHRVKMLTREGQLVWVEVSKTKTLKTRLSNKALFNWLKLKKVDHG